MHFATELAQKLGDYEKVWGRLRAEAGLGPVRKAAVLEHQGTPDGSSCRDYHKQCAWWADKVPATHLLYMEALLVHEQMDVILALMLWRLLLHLI